METNLLDTFVMVADSEGLSAAGIIMGIPQSIVSRRIKELETLCGTRLLYRNGRGVKLTPAGITLYQSARPLIAQLAAAISSIEEQEANPAGVVTVAMVPALMSAAGLRVIDEMDKRYPKVTIEMVSGYSRYILEWLLQGRVDIGILSDSGLSSQLIAEELGTARIVLAAKADFKLPPESAPGEIDFSALAGLPLVVPRKGQGLRRYIEHAAAQNGITLNIAYEINDIDLCKELVAAGRAVTLLSRPTIRKEVEAGVLIEKQFRSDKMYAHLVLTTARNRPITAAMRAAISVLKAESAKVLAEYG